jgi:membrane protein
MKKVKAFLMLFKDAIISWQEDKSVKLGAALSYYTVFSLPPLLVVLISLAGLFLNEKVVREQMIAQIGGLIGEQSKEVIQAMIQKASAGNRGMLATLIGFVVLVSGATGVFGELQDSLNAIFRVEAKPGGSIRTFIRTRLLSLGMIATIGFLLLVSLAVSAILSSFAGYMKSIMPEALVLILQIVNGAVSWTFISILFTFLFKVLPDIRIPWKYAILGAVFTAALFEIGKSLIGIYLGKSSIGSGYGAAGSLVLILIWVFYSSQILFFGAEVTKVYAKRQGAELEPKKHAQPVGKDELPPTVSKKEGLKAKESESKRLMSGGNGGGEARPRASHRDGEAER